MARVGVLIAGLNGATASTFVGGALAMALGPWPEEYGTTDLPPFAGLGLCSVADMEFGGWDYLGGSLSDAIGRHGILQQDLIAFIAEKAKTVRAMPAPRTSIDIPIELEHRQYWIPDSVQQAVDRLVADILEFKTAQRVEHLVLIYLGSPHRSGATPLRELDKDKLYRSVWRDSVPSSLLYALAAIESGADLVDFTPSETLEFTGLLESAASRGIQVAGRDGSTGQTMLKLAIAQMFQWRNFRIETWFSENLLGNHDGYVLSMPSHAVTKLRDKRDALSDQAGLSGVTQEVRIEYLKYWGDRKESWDAVECSGWLGNPISLRVNWRAGDSLLAAPLLLDLVRLLEHGHRQGWVGLQKQLGFFFKRPIAMEASSLAERFRHLCDAYRSDTGGGATT